MIIEALADHPGRSSIRAAESRQALNASEEVEQMLKSILPPNSGISDIKEENNRPEQGLDDMLSDKTSSLHGEEPFESSYDHGGRLAAERHAYLHFQHGMPSEDSVF